MGPVEEELQSAGRCMPAGRVRTEIGGGGHKPPAEISPQQLPGSGFTPGIKKMFVFLKSRSGQHPKGAQGLECCVLSSLVSDFTRQEELQQVGAFLRVSPREVMNMSLSNHQ